MYIHKRSFFEITLPLTALLFICIGTSFESFVDGSILRWIFLFLLLSYLFLNGKLLICINGLWKGILIFYLVWCISTTLWSEIPILSLVKSTLFSMNIIVMLSAGSLWVIKFGFERSLQWLFLILLISLASGVFGAASTGTPLSGGGNFDAYRAAYKGLTSGSTEFGFLVAIVSPVILWKLYQYKTNRKLFLIWLAILIMDIHFLILSYCRSAAVIFMCILCFFVLSLPLSKKIAITLFSFFLIVITLIMIPISYWENLIITHVVKSSAISDPNENRILQSRSLKWKKSYEQAVKGGIMGGGFFVTIGDKNFDFHHNLYGGTYGREKGNSQFAIAEETGLIGLMLWAILVISFLLHVSLYYFRLTGQKKVYMGLVLGAIIGLLAESTVEAWWDSAAAAELICFWILVGIAHGMIHLERWEKINGGKCLNR